MKLQEKTNKNTIYTDLKFHILLVGGSGSGKTNPLLRLINRQSDIDKIYLYAKVLPEPK